MGDKDAAAGEIDPALLKESGRASAAQDMKDSAKLFADRAKAVEDTLIQAQAAENATFKRRNRLLIGLVCVLILLQVIQTWRTVFVSGPKLDNIDKTVQGPISDANTKLDTITSFIHDVQAQQTDAPNQAQLFIELLCTTSDPVTVQYCIDNHLITEEG